MITPETIEKAYTHLMDAQIDFASAAEIVIDARATLERARALALLDGTITGKNEAERDARAREEFALGYENLAQYERAERDKRLTLDLAQLQVEKIRALLRLEEVLAHGRDHVTP